MSQFHRLITIHERTLDVVFSRFKDFLVDNKPKEVPRRQQRESMRMGPQGYLDRKTPKYNTDDK